MKVVLFCGGLGMRMREHEASAPKPMAMVGDRPLLWHVMRYYAHFGHNEFILCLGYGAAAVKEFFLRYDETLSNDFTLSAGGREIELHSADITDWKITFIDTGLHSTIGERLLRVREHVADEPMFMANYADTLTDAPLPDMIDRFRASGAVASMIVVPSSSTHHVVEMDDEGRVSHLGAVSELLQWENGGYFIMTPEIFDVVREGEEMVPTGLSRLIPAGKLIAQRYTGFFRAADTFKDRAELEAMYHRGERPWMVWEKTRRPVPGGA